MPRTQIIVEVPVPQPNADGTVVLSIPRGSQIIGARDSGLNYPLILCLSVVEVSGFEFRTFIVIAAGTSSNLIRRGVGPRDHEAGNYVGTVGIYHIFSGPYGGDAASAQGTPLGWT